MNGWHGTILKVDLTSATSWREEIPHLLLEEYLGARGLCVRLMRDYYQLAPFDSAMPLIFGVGPLCGTHAPASARISVTSRSPLTGTIYDCSAGGHFATQLKASGVDALFITGRSSCPVILKIVNAIVEIIPASHLWGVGLSETFDMLNNLGSVAAIGTAGENGVLFANIMLSGGDYFARGGMGAVMGSKNLKAITVKGDSITQIANPELFEKSTEDIMRLFKASPIIFGPLGVSEYGTSVLVDLMAQRRMTPTENFSKTYFEGSVNYSATTIKKEYNPIKTGCCDCPIQCKKISAHGKVLPEYDALSHFGALINIDNLQSILEFNDECNELGMDSISAAATLSAWGEISGKYLLADEIKAMLHNIAERKLDGETLSLGSRRLAEKMGKPELSMSVKSLELPAYDPRGAYGMALAYCSSNHGGCHLSAYPISHEILRKPVPTNRFSFSGKARIISIAEDANAAIDSIAVCKIAFLGATLEEYSELLTAVTGISYSPQQLQKIGRRIFMTERFYNCQNGFSRADDMLPERFFTEAGSSGDGIVISPIDKVRFEEELDKYYLIRCLNKYGCFADLTFLEMQP